MFKTCTLIVDCYCLYFKVLFGAAAFPLSFNCQKQKLSTFIASQIHSLQLQPFIEILHIIVQECVLGEKEGGCGRRGTRGGDESASGV